MSQPQPQSQILLLGATGRTGRLLLTRALSLSYHITILIRNPNPTPPLPSHKNLTVVTGDPCSQSSIESALLHTSTALPWVIISTLGQTRSSGNPWSATTSPPLFMSHSASAVLAASSSLSLPPIKKFIIMSMFGTGDSFPQLNFLMRFVMMHSNMHATLEDQNAVDEVVKDGNLPYVLVRPAMLKEGEAQKVRVLGERGELGGGFMPSVTGGSVVEFIMGCVQGGEWDGRTPVIAN